MTSNAAIKLGVCGLGRAFMLMLPTLLRDERIELVAAADPRVEARQRFETEIGGLAFERIENLCALPDIEAVYVASPHEMHLAHAKTVALSGKALLLEKPMALTVEDSLGIVDAVDKAGTVCVIGPSHSFDEPYMQASRMLNSGEYGCVRHFDASNFTNFACRPRRAEEMTPAAGGAVLNQGPHQLDVLRLFAGSAVKQVHATTCSWDSEQAIIGAYNASLIFENGVTANLTYNGYGHYDSAIEFGGIGELGRMAQESALPKNREARTFGPLGVADARAATHHEHFGNFVISCDNAALHPRPDGVIVYRNGVGKLHPAIAATGLRTNVIDELYNALRNGVEPLRGAHWGAATVRICAAILESANRGQAIKIHH